MKKVLSVLLALCLLTGAVPVFCSAAEDSAISLTAKKTDIAADVVINDNGYGSLRILGTTGSDGSITRRPQAALVDKKVQW